jgi:hypothetical protein
MMDFEESAAISGGSAKPDGLGFPSVMPLHHNE